MTYEKIVSSKLNINMNDYKKINPFYQSYFFT